jgi:hypothetical protein
MLKVKSIDDYKIITTSGIVLEAKPVESGAGCKGCVFDDDEVDDISCWDITNCIKENREDETDVIWVISNAS